jgi:hypothetical protein
MTRQDETLLAEIEHDLLDGKPLADLVRQCIMPGGGSVSVELRGRVWPRPWLCRHRLE